MAIERVRTDKSAIRPGRFVLFDGFSDQLCGPPCKVVRLVGTRVFFSRENADPYGTPEASRCASRVKYVCDTLEEGMTLYQLGEARRAELQRACAAVVDKYENQLGELCAA